MLITDYPMGVDDYRLYTMMDYVRDNGGVLVTFGHNITQDTDYALRMSYERLNNICEYAQTDNLKFYRASDLVTKQPPIANFTSSLTSGIAPLNVSLTDTSIGSPTSWSWNFGDGSNSTVQNPVHTYSAAGNYTVSLTVSNAGGSNTTTKTDYITVTTWRPPVAAFSASPTSGAAPLTVAFTDASTGSPTSGSWNFGDGSNSTVQNPVHTYSAAGNYTVSLTVSNAGGTNTTTKTDYIVVTTSAPPVAAFSASPTSGAAPLTVAFTDASTGSPTSGSWNFGDGSNSTVQNPVHTYSAAGNYTVSLTVSNAGGTNTTTKTDYIMLFPLHLQLILLTV